MNTKQFLKTMSDELHKPAKKKFPRRKVYVDKAYSIFSIDLADLSAYSTENDGYKYILTCIDIFSRKTWGVPIKNKDAPTILAAFKKILKEAKHNPDSIYADDGPEWKGVFSKFLTDNNITMYHTYSAFHASPIERFHRTLKNLINRYFTEHNTHAYILTLPAIFQKYNTTKHSSIDMTPNEAILKKNQKKAHDYQYRDMPTAAPTESKFKLGDKVRISRSKNVFEKEGWNWSQEIFTVDTIQYTNPITYRIVDSKGELVIGSFYEQELQKTELDGMYLVEKILKKRTVKGKKEVLVKWIGYSDDFNSWEPESSLNELS